MFNRALRRRVFVYRNIYERERPYLLLNINALTIAEIKKNNNVGVSITENQHKLRLQCNKLAIVLYLSFIAMYDEV